MSSVVIYDVSAENSGIKSAMKLRGYTDRWTALDSNGIKSTFYLPESTLWNKNKTRAEALLDIKFVTSSFGVELQRCIVLSAYPWEGIKGIL